MPANARVSTGTVPGAHRLYATIGEFSHDLWTVPELLLSSGLEASTATIEIPVMDIENSTVSVALNPDVMGRFLHGQRVKIHRNGGSEKQQLIFAGSVCQINANTEKNSLIIQASDDRIFLNNLRIVGRIVAKYNGPGSHSPLYQSGFACHFNPGGRANCMLTDENYYVFSPYLDYGLGPDEVPLAPTTAKAGYWTPSRIMQYFEEFYTGEKGVEIQTLHPFFQMVPDTLTWQPTFGAVLDSLQAGIGTPANPNENTAQGRKGRDINCAGLGLLDLIQMLTEGTGYTFTLGAKVEKDENDEEVVKNELILIPARYTGSGNVVALAGGAASENWNGDAVATAIEYVEDSRNTLSSVAVLGALAEIETRVST